MVAGTLYLGSWQTQRYFWKIDLIEKREKLMAEDPVPLPSLVKSGDTGDFDNRRVALYGYFEHGKEQFVGPRGPPAGVLPEGVPGAVHTGMTVITPFVRCSVDGTPEDRVLVNRGWLPKDEIRYRDSKAAEEAPELILLTAVVTEGEAGNAFSVASDAAAGKFYYVDLPEIASAAGVVAPDGAELPLFVSKVADDGADAVSIPEFGRSRGEGAEPLCRQSKHFLQFYVDPFKHATYAFTWFALATCGTAAMYFRFRKKPPMRGKPNRPNRPPVQQQPASESLKASESPK